MHITVSILILSTQFRCYCAFFESPIPQIDNVQCASQIQSVVDGFKKREQWVLDMVDSTAKYPSGIRRGNLKQTGHFDQCVSIYHKTETNSLPIKGKYCFPGVAFPISQNRNYNMHSTDFNASSESLKASNFFRLEHLEFPFRSKYVYSDVLMMAVCLPDQCKPSELFGSLGLDTNCIIKGNDLDYGDISFLIFISIVIVTVAASTCYDVLLQKYQMKPVCRVLIAFSLYTNGNKVFASSNNPKQLKCLNGIRFLSMIWVIAGHRFASSQSLPYINGFDTDKWLQSTYSQYIQSARYAVDTFFFLSGVLLAYGLIPVYTKMKINFSKATTASKKCAIIISSTLMAYIHRYLRLTPALAVLYFFHVTIYKHLTSGPFWPLVHEPITKSCLENWWPFFLYVQNYINPDNLCMVHTWYLSIDMQMFVVSPLILWPVVVFPKKTMYILGAILIPFLVTPFLAIFLSDPGMYTELYYEVYYYLTHTRLSPWIIGIMLGVLLHEQRHTTFKINWWMNASIWVLVLGGFAAIIFCEHDVIYNYNKTKAAIYTDLSRPAWALGLFWTTWSCLKGRGGIINTFLSLDSFEILARITYSMYLVHFPIIGISIGHTRIVDYFDDFSRIYLVCGDVIFTLLLCIVWTLLFESPIIAIEKVILRRGK